MKVKIKVEDIGWGLVFLGSCAVFALAIFGYLT